MWLAPRGVAPPSPLAFDRDLGYASFTMGIPLRHRSFQYRLLRFETPYPRAPRRPGVVATERHGCRRARRPARGEHSAGEAGGRPDQHRGRRRRDGDLRPRPRPARAARSHLRDRKRLHHPSGRIHRHERARRPAILRDERNAARRGVPEKAVAQACGPALARVPERARKERLRALAADPVNRGNVQLFKRLQVHLSTGEIYAAEVKAYSPAIKAEEEPLYTKAGSSSAPSPRGLATTALMTLMTRRGRPGR